MTDLPPIDTDEDRTALRWSNRLWIATRPGREWPAGVLEECERLDGEHPGWDVMWASGSRALRSAPAYSAQWLGSDRVAGGDQAYSHGADAQVRPRVLGATVAELVEQIAAMDKRIADQREDSTRLDECLRRGLG